MRAFRTVLLFAISGCVGFLVDAVVLYLLMDVVGLYWGRAFSFFCAAFSTWLMNRNWAFRGRKSGLSKSREVSRYICLMLGGGIVNYLVYVVLVGKFAFVRDLPVIGVAVGSLVGMLFNIATSRFLIYRFADTTKIN